MIPELRELLESLRKSRPTEKSTAPVLRVFEAEKSMRRAAANLGIPHLRHHDLRHLFASTCIESGLDIPTVSRLLGHKDGGALAMKVYGHLRQEHSALQAQRVRFALPSLENNVVTFAVARLQPQHPIFLLSTERTVGLHVESRTNSRSL